MPTLETSVLSCTSGSAEKRIVEDLLPEERTWEHLEDGLQDFDKSDFERLAATMADDAFIPVVDDAAMRQLNDRAEDLGLSSTFVERTFVPLPSSQGCTITGVIRGPLHLRVPKMTCR